MEKSIYEYSETVVTATEFKSNLGKFLEDAIDKKETSITKNGKKIARLVPYIQDFTGYLLAEESAQYHSKTVSYQEFLDISSGVEARMEYINGEIIMQSSPNSFHQDAVGNLHVTLKTYLKGKKCKVFLAPFDVTLYKEGIKDPDVIQPDLLVACDTDTAINEKGRYSGVPALVIEVLSPSTRSRDMVDKLNTFMRAGCTEYWIVDIDHTRVMQYCFADREIDIYEIYSKSDCFKSRSLAGLEVCVEDIFEG